MSSISQTNMRGVIYKALYNNLSSSVPSGWLLKAKMPSLKNINSSLPLVVMSVSIDDTELPSFDKTSARYFTASVSFMFVAADSNKAMEDVDKAVDAIRNALLAKQSTWKTNGFGISNISEEMADMEVNGQNRFITSALSAIITPFTN